jgi:hypothetical protein
LILLLEQQLFQGISAIESRPAVPAGRIDYRCAVDFHAGCAFETKEQVQAQAQAQAQDIAANDDALCRSYGAVPARLSTSNAG